MKASRWEILGAWLRIWTPPRDVEIPPIPWRKVGALAGVCALVAGGLYAVIAPAIDRGKQHRAAEDRRARAAFVRAERARLTLDQRVQRARAPRVARLHAAGRDPDARAALIAHVQASVERDARARAATGEFDHPARRVRCTPLPGRGAARVRLECLAITTETRQVRVGQPFLVAGSLRDGRYAWCHHNPRPAEGALGTDIAVELSRACSGAPATAP